MDTELLKPMLPHLPSGPVSNEIMKMSQYLDLSVPREVSRNVIAPMAELWKETREVQRKHAVALDNAHSLLAHKTDLRFGTLDRIAATLLDKRPDEAPSRAEILATRLALKSAPLGFLSDDLALVGDLFNILPKEFANTMQKVAGWIREFQESAASRSSACEGGERERKGEAEGPRIVKAFIKKARELIQEHRKLRVCSAPETACMGSSMQKLSLASETGSFSILPGTTTFTADEQLIIRAVEEWSVTCRATNWPGSATICFLLRHIGLYENHQLWPPCGQLFLQEIGVIEPWANRVLQDPHLLLPTSMHSKPLLQLAARLQSIKMEDVELKDAMAHLRHDFKDLPVYTIDDHGAVEVDDGISIEQIPGSPNEHWLHIHIANPTCIITKDSLFARMAAHMTETFYSPEEAHRMLPSWISNLCSVRPNARTLTFSARLNEKSEVVDTKIRSGIVRNVIHISYDDVDRALHWEMKPAGRQVLVVGDVDNIMPQPPPYQTLDKRTMSDFRLLRRVLSGYRRNASTFGLEDHFDKIENAQPKVRSSRERGGIPFTWSHREAPIRAIGDPVISLHTRTLPLTWRLALDLESSREVVAYAMRLAGEIAAKWTVDRGLPNIYRGNPAFADTRLQEKALVKDEIEPAMRSRGYLNYNQMLRFLYLHGGAWQSAKPLEHRTLGIAQYARVTSPLRRYTDMVCHWIIEAAMRHEDKLGRSLVGAPPGSIDLEIDLPFTPAKLEAMAARLYWRGRRVNQAKRATVAYWTSMFLHRAWNCGELDLARHFNVLITCSEHGRGAQAPNTARGYWMEYSIPLIVDTASLEYEGIHVHEGDEVEVEAVMVRPWDGVVLVAARRLVSRDADR